MSYRAVFSVPGAAAFTATGLAVRLPQSIYPVSLVLLASLSTGDYAIGALLVAAFILGSAVGNPLLSRAADRWSQRRVLLATAPVHILLVAALLAAVERGAPSWLQVAAAALVGGSYVPAAALVRARWSYLFLGAPDRLGTALSMESIIDEAIFVVGPLVAASLATLVHPTAPFVLIGILVGAGSIGLALLQSTAPPVTRHTDERPSPLPRGVTTQVVLVAVAAGVALVGIDLAAIAFVGQAGQAPWTGAVVGCFAFGSGVAGAAYGARHWRRPVQERLVPTATVFAVLPLLLPLASGVPVLAAVMFVVGSGTAPLLITLFGVMERLAPDQRTTEALAWVLTGIYIGAGLAAPVVGALADSRGARTAMVVPIVAGLAAGGFALLAAGPVRRSVPRATL